VRDTTGRNAIFICLASDSVAIWRRQKWDEGAFCCAPLVNRPATKRGLNKANRGYKKGKVSHRICAGRKQCGEFERD
jgi:hypothetical protein